jgi:hypothetical protein
VAGGVRASMSFGGAPKQSTCCMIRQEKGVRRCARPRGEDRDQNRAAGHLVVIGIVCAWRQMSRSPARNFVDLKVLRRGEKERRLRRRGFYSGLYLGKGARVSASRRD